MICIKALCFSGSELSIAERPQPVAGEGELLIEVDLAGICNTDLEITAGYLSFQGILGHEFVGRVVEDPKGELAGVRVVGSINLPCQHCYLCRRGQKNHCKQMKALGIRGKDGAFAEYLTLPRENIYPLPEGIDDEEAVFVEPLAAAVEILEQVHIRPTERTAVLGDGKLGLLTAMVFFSAGLEVTLIGRHPEKLAVAGEMGIDTILGVLPGQRFDLLVEASGNPGGLEEVLGLVEPEGRIVYKTTTADRTGLDLSLLAVNELKIIGSRCGPFAPTLRLLQRKEFPLKRMIDSIYPLEEGLEALERAGEKGVLKVLLQMKKG